MINLVAAAVGPGHRVDLKHYDVLILVDIFKVRDRAISFRSPVPFASDDVEAGDDGNRSIVDSTSF